MRINWSAPATTYGLAYTYQIRLGVWNGTDYVYGNAISTGTTTYYDWDISGYSRGQRLYAQVRAVNIVGAGAWAGNNIALYYNRKPNTPTLVFPKPNSVTYNTQPRLGFLYATDPDGQSVLGYCQMDDSTKDGLSSYWSKTGRQTTAVQALVRGWTLATGEHTVNFYSNDGLVNSDVQTVDFEVLNTNFTDATIVKNVTPVKAIHFIELRTAIENVYDYYGLVKPTWIDEIVAGGLIKAQHILEMRQAIEAVRQYVNSFDNGGTSKDIPAFTWTDATLANKRIKAQHITELRNAIKQL